jgi:hypothetical protein
LHVWQQADQNITPCMLLLLLLLLLLLQQQLLLPLL